MGTKKWWFVGLGMVGLLGGGNGLEGSLFGMVSIAGAASATVHLDNKNLKVPPRANAPLTYNFDEHWGVEGSVDAVNTLPADGPTNASSDNDGTDIRGFLYTINGIYRFNKLSLFQPYVLAGIGILGLPNAPEGLQSNNINAGVGTQFFVSDAVALHGEVRDIYATTGNNKNDYNINLGISFLLGDLNKP